MISISRRRTPGTIWLIIAVAALSSPVRSQTLPVTSNGDNQCDIKFFLGTPGLNHPPEPPPGRIRIMGARYDQLENALRGYEKFHVPLVSYDGRMFGPAGATDDVGAYYFVPRLALHLRMPLRRTIDGFYLTVLVVAFGLGILGCYLTLRTGMAKMWAIMELVLLMAVAYGVGDVYILQAAVVVAIVPLALSISEVSRVSIVAPFMFGSGLAISIANTFRSHSGTGVLLFLLCLVSTSFVGSNYRKIALMMALLCGLVLPNLYFSRVIEERDNFLRSVCPNYPQILRSHPFWHSVYIGFGYLTNEVVTGYNDQVAYDKVQSIVPDTLYVSAEYERILRQQVWLLLRQHPNLVLYTLAAKLGVICALFLLSANVGLIAARFVRKPIGLELAFWIGIVFCALSGVLVVPLVAYLLGFMTFVTLYGIVTLDVALQKFQRAPHQPAAIGASSHSNIRAASELPA
jgi:hypothetical protein